MADKTIDRFPMAAGVNCAISEDQESVAFVFPTNEGTVGVGLPAKDIGAVIAQLVRVAQTIEIKTPTEAPESEMISAYPIDLAALGVLPGRTPDEALLAAKAGPLTLMFAVQLSTLFETFEDLRAHARIDPRA